MDEKKSYYEILGIDKDADESQIKSAYRRLAKKYHPDLNKKDPNANSKFIQLKEAYDTLINPIKRRIYDNAGYDPRNLDIGDIFRRYNNMSIQDILRAIYSRNLRREPYYKPPPEGMYI